MLSGRGKHRIWQATVANHAVGSNSQFAGRRDDAAAPVAEQVAIGRVRHGRTRGQMIGDDDVGGAREVRTQHHDHRRRLWKFVVHFESDANLHSKYLPYIFLQMATKPANTSRKRSIGRIRRETSS